LPSRSHPSGCMVLRIVWIACRRLRQPDKNSLPPIAVFGYSSGTLNGFNAYGPMEGKEYVGGSERLSEKFLRVFAGLADGLVVECRLAPGGELA